MQISALLKEAIQQALALAFPEGTGDAEVTLEAPPNPSYGDLSTPICLKLARVLRSNPLQIAERLRAALAEQELPCIVELSVTAPGYVNFRLDYPQLAQTVLSEVLQQGEAYGQLAPDSARKIVIEHTNINPNKAAHIGHLRNACLGDTLARMLRGVGCQVEVQNYIDDTGTAVADIVVGFEVLGWQEDERSFDYFCWDLYTAINDRYENEPELKQKQLQVLHQIEQGDNEVARTAKQISERIVRCHLQTMARMGIFYNILTWESDILQLGFWKHAFATLQGNGALVHESEGPNEGCWVVKLGEHEEFAGMENPDKVLVRSNGTATYVAKDISYQLWKFGVLGKDFNYRQHGLQPNGEPLWTSTVQDGEAGSFGRADRVINVIDIRQKYLQDVLRVSLDQLGFHQQAENSIHFGYEVVALSAEAARELGVSMEAADERGVYAMAGRRGIGVKADDLIDRVVAKATEEVRLRHPDFSEERNRSLGEQIAQAAIRYYMQRYNMNSLIVFDFGEALNMKGNSGPYLQYAHARANRILERAAEAGLVTATVQPPAQCELNESERNLVRCIAELPEVLQRAAEGLAPSQLADYAYQLASAFMGFYEVSPVMNAEAELASFRLALVAAFKQALANTLSLLGIPAMTQM